MNIIDYKCTECGKECTRITFDGGSVCRIGICCKCCKKQGVQPLECKMSQLELKRLASGKRLNKNEIKGLLLERSVSTALHSLKIPHTPNPFNNTYPCYQNKRPDITIPKIDVVIECKNLSKKQVDHTVSEPWLDKNVIKRRYSLKYRHKIVLFSFKPRKSLCLYLNKHGWKVHGLGTQILTPAQERKAKGKLIRNFYWLKKEYYGNRLLKPKQQTRLKPSYLQVIR